MERCQGHALRACLVRDPGVRVSDLLYSPQYRDRWIDEMPVHTLDVLSRQLQPGQRALLRAFAIYCEAVPLETIRAVVAGGHKGGQRPA